MRYGATTECPGTELVRLTCKLFSSVLRWKAPENRANCNNNKTIATSLLAHNNASLQLPFVAVSVKNWAEHLAKLKATMTALSRDSLSTNYPRTVNFLKGAAEVFGNRPARVMSLHFVEI